MEGAHACRMCGKLAPSHALNVEHMKTHLKAYRCMDCGYRFMRPEDLEDHLVEEHNYDENGPGPPVVDLTDSDSEHSSLDEPEVVDLEGDNQTEAQLNGSSVGVRPEQETVVDELDIAAVKDASPTEVAPSESVARSPKQGRESEVSSTLDATALQGPSRRRPGPKSRTCRPRATRKAPCSASLNSSSDQTPPTYLLMRHPSSVGSTTPNGQPMTVKVIKFSPSDLQDALEMTMPNSPRPSEDKMSQEELGDQCPTQNPSSPWREESSVFEKKSSYARKVYPTAKGSPSKLLCSLKRKCLSSLDDEETPAMDSEYPDASTVHRRTSQDPVISSSTSDQPNQDTPEVKSDSCCTEQAPISVLPSPSHETPSKPHPSPAKRARRGPRLRAEAIKKATVKVKSVEHSEFQMDCATQSSTHQESQSTLDQPWRWIDKIMRDHCLEDGLGCAICGNLIKKRGVLVRHILKHLHYNPGKTCLLCGEVLPSKVALNEHYVQVHPNTKICTINKISPKKCPPNSEELPSRVILDEHCAEMHPKVRPCAVSKIRSKTCQSCGEVLPSKVALEEHNAQVHSKIKQNSVGNICYNCNRGFLSNMALRVHMLDCEPPEDSIPLNGIPVKADS